MFGLLYQECLQTGPLVFIWIFHFILPRVIRLFRVYSEWWIISFIPLRSLKTRWTARACPKGGGYVRVCVAYAWLEIMAPRVHGRCLISLQRRQHADNRGQVWPCGRQKPFILMVTPCSLWKSILNFKSCNRHKKIHKICTMIHIFHYPQTWFFKNYLCYVKSYPQKHRGICKYT